MVLKAEEKLIKRIRTNEPVFFKMNICLVQKSVVFLVLLLCLYANFSSLLCLQL